MDQCESSKPRKGKSYLKWTVAMDRVLTNVLVEQHNLGNHPPNGWKLPAYTVAINALKDQCGVTVTKENINARLKTWDKHYATISDMLRQSGFGWDWDRNMVTVDNEAAWASYVAARPDVGHYRGKIIDNWAELGIICGGDHATGEGAETGLEAMSDRTLFENESISDTPTPPTSQKRQQTSFVPSQSSGKKRSRSSESLASAVDHMADTIAKVYEVDSAASVEEIFAALSEIPNLDQQELLRIFDILSNDARKFKQFMALPLDLKRPWVLLQIHK